MKCGKIMCASICLCACFAFTCFRTGRLRKISQDGNGTLKKKPTLAVRAREPIEKETQEDREDKGGKRHTVTETATQTRTQTYKARAHKNQTNQQIPAMQVEKQATCSLLKRIVAPHVRLCTRKDLQKAASYHTSGWAQGKPFTPRQVVRARKDFTEQVRGHQELD